MDTAIAARSSTAVFEGNEGAFAPRASQTSLQIQPVAIEPAFTPARKTPIDMLFTGHALLAREAEKAGQADSHPSVELGFMGDIASEAVAGIPRLGLTRNNFMSPTEKAANKISPDIYLTQRILPPMIPRNPSMAALRLLERVGESTAALWRNPLQMIIRNWKRRELMHVFNGFFHAAIDDPERYDTYGSAKSWPTFEMS